MRVPNIDISSDDAGAVRTLAGGSGFAAPVHKSISLFEALGVTKWLATLTSAPTLRELLKADHKL